MSTVGRGRGIIRLATKRKRISGKNLHSLLNIHFMRVKAFASAELAGERNPEGGVRDWGVLLPLLQPDAVA